MTGDVDHVLLTRFNLPSMGVENIIRAKEGWLIDRIELFELYCLPSVRTQTNQQFHWIIYFDPESPEWLKRRIQNHADDGAYVPIFRTSVSNTDLVADIGRVTGRRGTRLITTNLDNDDGLAIDFVERLQAVGPCQDRTAVYLARGLIKSESRIYLRRTSTTPSARSWRAGHRRQPAGRTGTPCWGRACASSSSTTNRAGYR